MNSYKVNEKRFLFSLRVLRCDSLTRARAHSQHSSMRRQLHFRMYAHCQFVCDGFVLIRHDVKPNHFLYHLFFTLFCFDRSVFAVRELVVVVFDLAYDRSHSVCGAYVSRFSLLFLIQPSVVCTQFHHRHHHHLHCAQRVHAISLHSFYAGNLMSLPILKQGTLFLAKNSLYCGVSPFDRFQTDTIYRYLSTDI